MQSSISANLSSKKLKSLSEEFFADPLVVRHLDASNNLLKTGRSLERFANLQTLLLDENLMVNVTEFPTLYHLEHLSLIKNNIQDLDDFLRLCKEKFPKLVDLNLMKNPVCPPFFLEEEAYHNYRQKVLRVLPRLQILDGFPVSIKDSQPFVSEIKPIEEESTTQGLGKVVVRQQYVEDDQAKGVVEHNPKYGKVSQNRNILKGTSQGNKHITNEKL